MGFKSRKTETEYAIEDCDGKTILIVKIVSTSASQCIFDGEFVTGVVIYGPGRNYVCDMNFADFKSMCKGLREIRKEFSTLHEQAIVTDALQQGC